MTERKLSPEAEKVLKHLKGIPYVIIAQYTGKTFLYRNDYNHDVYVGSRMDFSDAIVVHPGEQISIESKVSFVGIE
jgi:hypothetical protein